MQCDKQLIRISIIFLHAKIRFLICLPRYLRSRKCCRRVSVQQTSFVWSTPSFVCRILSEPLQSDAGLPHAALSTPDGWGDMIILQAHRCKMDDMCKKEKVRQSKSETLPLHPSTYRARKCFLCENDELLLLLKNLCWQRKFTFRSKIPRWRWAFIES